MGNYSYSPSQNTFYANALKEIQYSPRGVWPEDAVDIEDAMHLTFTAAPPEGKKMIAGANGFPAWGVKPPLTHDELISAIEAERQRLLNYADSIIADWRTELMLGDISETDKEKLSAWMAFKRDVKAVSSTLAIEPGFTWPKLPAV